MATCPRCQFANPDGFERCAECGAPWSAAEPADSPAGPFGVSLSAPLPAPEPMVEPVYTPSKFPPRDAGDAPDSPTLTRSLRDPRPAAAAGEGTVAALPALGGANPSAMTVRSRPARPAPTTATDLPAVSKPAPLAVPADATPLPAALPPAAAAPAAPPTPPPAPAVSPKFVVLRGERMNAVHPLYEGRNTIGRFADKPVDVDLEGQEPVERIRISRVHAAVTVDRTGLSIEDLNSLNGTWVNGARIHPGQHRRLAPNDVVQVGTVQLRLVLE